MKTLLIDLDGVLNEYTGNFNEKNIPKIKAGAKEFLEKISKNYEVKIFTARNRLLTAKWLIYNKIDKYIKDITNIKEPAWLYIDDRNIKFNGSFDILTDEIENFKVWYK